MSQKLLLNNRFCFRFTYRWEWKRADLILWWCTISDNSFFAKDSSTVDTPSGDDFGIGQSQTAQNENYCECFHGFDSFFFSGSSSLIVVCTWGCSKLPCLILLYTFFVTIRILSYIFLNCKKQMEFKMKFQTFYVKCFFSKLMFNLNKVKNNRMAIERDEIFNTLYLMEDAER